jgi:hypothetical protein
MDHGEGDSLSEGAQVVGRDGLRHDSQMQVNQVTWKVVGGDHLRGERARGRLGGWRFGGGRKKNRNHLFATNASDAYRCARPAEANGRVIGPGRAAYSGDELHEERCKPLELCAVGDDAKTKIEAGRRTRCSAEACAAGRTRRCGPDQHGVNSFLGGGR